MMPLKNHKNYLNHGSQGYDSLNKIYNFMPSFSPEREKT